MPIIDNLGQVQIGNHPTQTQNFTLDSSAANGTVTLYRGNIGTTTTPILSVNSSNVVTPAAGFGFATAGGSGTPTKDTLLTYEEGTWTPTQGAGLTVVGAFSSNATYTKIGRLVTVSGRINGATSVACTAAGELCPNLPFTSQATYFNWGLASNNVGTTQVQCNVGPSSTSLTLAGLVGGIAATTTIWFQITYMASA